MTLAAGPAARWGDVARAFRSTVRPELLRPLFGVLVFQVVSFAVTFGSRLVLARLLVPADFGLFALALFVVTVAQALRDFGLSSHLMREDERCFGNALALEVGAAVVLVAAIGLGRGLFAPVHPTLPAILPLLSLVLVPDGVSAVCLALFGKRLLLHRAVLPELLALGLAAGASIILAAAGYGVWSLVLGHCLGAAAKAGLLWLRARPLFPPGLTLAYTGRLLRGSLYFGLIGLMGLGLSDLDKAILGVVVPAEALGYYVVAFSLVYFPCLFLEAPLRRLAYPAFVQARGEGALLHERYRGFTLASLAVELPLYLFLALEAQAIVRLLYGTRWLAAAPLVVWMSFLPLVDPFSKFGNSLLQAVGREGIQYWASIPYLAFFVVVGWVLAREFGVPGMIVANYLQVGGWAITGYYLKVAGRPWRLLAEVAALYAVAGAGLLAAGLLASQAGVGGVVVHAGLTVGLWAIFAAWLGPGIIGGAWPALPRVGR